MVKFHVPIRLQSLSNTRLHWRRMVAIKKMQRAAVKCCLVGLTSPSLPATVLITRVGPRKLDNDNLASACKYVRDQIAEWFGVDDGSLLYTWRYAQQTGKYGVDVEVINDYRAHDEWCLSNSTQYR